MWGTLKAFKGYGTRQRQRTGWGGVNCALLSDPLSPSEEQHLGLPLCHPSSQRAPSLGWTQLLFNGNYGCFDTGDHLAREVWPGQQIRMLSSSSAMAPRQDRCAGLGGPEDVWDDIVSVNTVNQPGSIVVYEPAGHLGPLPGVLAIVFL